MKNTSKILAFILFIVVAGQASAQYVPPEKRDKKQKETKTELPTPAKKEENKSETETSQSTKTDKKSGKSFGERLVLGGSPGFTLGNITRIDFLPQVGYRFSDNFIAGVGGTYHYYSAKFSSFNINVSENFYGGRVFGQYFITPQFFSWVEGEATNGNFFNQETRLFERQWVVSPLAGLGYHQSVGDIGLGFYFMVLYNLTYDENLSLYSSPFVPRVGFNYQF